VSISDYPSSGARAWKRFPSNFSSQLSAFCFAPALLLSSFQLLWFLRLFAANNLPRRFAPGSARGLSSVAQESRLRMSFSNSTAFHQISALSFLLSAFNFPLCPTPFSLAKCLWVLIRVNSWLEQAYRCYFAVGFISG
jgi:hypothetical protein